MVKEHPIVVPETTLKKERHGLALCLSGGGFRASLFHLGAVRRLHELGVLRKVDAISSVSGGSIFSGFLATRAVKLAKKSGADFSDWQKEVSDPFREFASRDLRTVLILAHVLWNWVWPQPRVQHLERRYRRWLTDLRLSDLPEKPLFILCAADLVFGVNWEFSSNRVGDYQAGYAEKASEWPLARAIAASSCFPPIFGPMKLPVGPGGFSGGKYREPDRPKLLGKVCLSDGGVYDNMGLEPVWQSFAYVLISDCDAPFDFKVGSLPWSRLLRYSSVITNQTRALRLRSLFAELNDGKYRGCYWSLSDGVKPGCASQPGYSCELGHNLLAEIRTDLDNFSDAEMSVLENHGYFCADHKVRKYVPELVETGAPSPQAPYPHWMDEAKVRKALSDSHNRLSLPRLLRGLSGWRSHV